MYRRRWATGTLATLLGVSLLTTGLASSAGAATFTVTRTDDPAADGCAPDDCSLREAVEAANDSPGFDTVTLPAGTYVLDGPVVSTDPIAIQGADRDTSIIDANGAAFALAFTEPADEGPAPETHLPASQLADVTVTGASVVGLLVVGNGLYDRIDMEISNVAVSGNQTGGYGGFLFQLADVDVSDSSIANNSGYYTGGGVTVLGVVTVTDSVVSGNSSDSSYAGGVVNAVGSLTIAGSEVSGNSGMLGGGLLDIQSLALDLLDIDLGAVPGVHLVDSTVSGNSAALGGGVFGLQLANVSLTRTSVTGNDALGGGAAATYAFSPLTVNDSLISGNTAAAAAGILDVFNLDLSLLSEHESSPFTGLDVTNSTIAGNESWEGGGSGLFNVISDEMLTNVTIAGNKTAEGEGGGGIWAAGFGDENGPANTRLVNTIVSGNDASPGLQNCEVYQGSLELGAQEHLSAIYSLGNNLEDLDTCPFFEAGDLLETDPLLAGLADNGGATMSMALGAGSPAIDAGNNLLCPLADQIGNVRPLDGNSDGSVLCDIGALEALGSNGRAPNELVFLPEQSDSGTVGSPFTVNVAVQDQYGDPINGSVTVQFTVRGANPTTGRDRTDSHGVATFTYTGTNAGTDTLTAWVDMDNDGALEWTEPKSRTEVVWSAAAPARASDGTDEGISKVETFAQDYLAWTTAEAMSSVADLEAWAKSLDPASGSLSLDAMPLPGVTDMVKSLEVAANMAGLSSYAPQVSVMAESLFNATQANFADVLRDLLGS